MKRYKCRVLFTDNERSVTIVTSEVKDSIIADMISPSTVALIIQSAEEGHVTVVNKAHIFEVLFEEVG